MRKHLPQDASDSDYQLRMSGSEAAKYHHFSDAVPNDAQMKGDAILGEREGQIRRNTERDRDGEGKRESECERERERQRKGLSAMQGRKASNKK